MKASRFKEKKKMKLSLKILLLVFICVFSYSLYNIIYWIKSNNDLKELETGVFAEVVQEIEVEEGEPEKVIDFDKLLEINDKDAIRDLMELFRTADLVKFAKHTPLMNENDANLVNAIDFINDTKEKEDENAKPQPTEITVVEKRSLRTKVLLGLGIAVLAAVLIGSLVYVGKELYNYFA